jgi:hypothetical protein
MGDEIAVALELESCAQDLKAPGGSLVWSQVRGGRSIWHR